RREAKRAAGPSLFCSPFGPVPASIFVTSTRCEGPLARLGYRTEVSMAEAPTLDFNAFVTKLKAERASGAARGEHDYSYILDRQTRATFESAKPIELAVASSVRIFKQVWRGQLLGSAVKVSERQFPRIQTLARECS